MLREAQAVFAVTGGLHACALVEAGGDLVEVCEDVGRHNALDKLIGNRLLNRQLPLDSHVLLLSGRTSFEMVQKAWAGGFSVLVSVSAPTSLAVQTARRANLVLAGFVRSDRLNIYSPERLD
jgi:FdhD protein